MAGDMVKGSQVSKTLRDYDDDEEGTWEAMYRVSVLAL